MLTHHFDIFSVYQKLPEQSIVMFHACAHNPTGVDPKVTIIVIDLQKTSVDINLKNSY